MVPSPKERFLGALEKEHATTMRVLRAYPADRPELRPHPKCKTARELAWAFAIECGVAEKALTTGFDWSAFPPWPPAPPSLVEILTAFEQRQRRVADITRGLPDEALFATIKFITAPKTISDVPRIQILWMMLCDQIHHRGQFSVYLRMADGKLPSIYGPTTDEPWM